MSSHHSSSHTPVADVQYVQYSQKMWNNFVKIAMYATAHVVVILLIMAATLL